MISQLTLPGDQPVIALTPEITYLQKPYWCNCSAQNLKLSLLAPRRYYSYDPAVADRPCIVFFCGGAFQKQDRSVWLAELEYFARNGYVVATVDYSTFAYTRYPEPLMEAKAAIRFLRAHAQEFHIDKNRIISMGESAGGQLACWLAVTGEDRSLDQGNNLTESSAVQCCVALYPVTNANAFPAPDSIRVRMDDFPNTCEMVTEKTPPCFLVHGTKDSQVPHVQSITFYEALQKNGVTSELLLLEGADHSDSRFYSPEVKERILHFLNASI